MLKALQAFRSVTSPKQVPGAAAATDAVGVTCVPPEHHPLELRKRVGPKKAGKQLVDDCLQATRVLATETDDRSVLLFFAMVALGRHPKGTSAKPDFVALYKELELPECAEAVGNGAYTAADLAYFWSSDLDFSRLFEPSDQKPQQTYKTSEDTRPIPKTIMFEEWGEQAFFEFAVHPDPLPPKHWNLYQLDDATIIYDTTESVVLDKTGRPIEELCSRDYRHVFFTRSFGDSLDSIPGLGQRRDKVKTLDKALMIQDVVPKPNFCHWLLDQLPRVRHLQPSQQLIMHQLSPFIEDSLALMSISTDRVVQLSEHRVIRIGQLTIDTSMARHWHHPCQQVNSELLAYVRESLRVGETDTPQQTAKRNVYISRNRSSRRHISNEPELLACLARYDFDIVYLEELSMTKQISTFKNAAVVIAPHGAGLSNVIFCDKASVIEIFNPNYGTPSFRLLSLLSGLRYQHLMGKGPVLNADERQHAGRAHLQWEDIEVDLAQLQQCLEKVLG